MARYGGQWLAARRARRCEPDACKKPLTFRFCELLRRCSCRAGPPAPVEVAVLGGGVIDVGFLPMAFTSRQIFCPCPSQSQVQQPELVRCENSSQNYWDVGICQARVAAAAFYFFPMWSKLTNKKPHPLLQTCLVSEISLNIIWDQRSEYCFCPGGRLATYSLFGRPYRIVDYLLLAGLV